MKKVLSIVLILAALFGLGAGFMDLQDVLSCKSYWETKGAESDASLTQLFDGLTTLQGNSKAYTEGVKTVADGEKKLEEGKATYEEGLATYNAGVEEYNSKLADYNKGMDDLGKGRNKILEAKTKLSGYTDARKATAIANSSDPAVLAKAGQVAQLTGGSTDKTAVTNAAASIGVQSTATATGKSVAEVQSAVAAAQQPATQAAAAKVNAAGANGSTSSTVVAQAALQAYATEAGIDLATAQSAYAAGGAAKTTVDSMAAAYGACAVATGVKNVATEYGNAYEDVAIAKGLSEFDAGMGDYYVAKGTLAWAEKKLAAAKEQLEAAEKQLAEGKKTIDDNEKLLNDGKASLKQYEEGEVQLKAGIAQVLDTKAEAGLTSIADRLGADFKYTDGDRLLIDKGFEAVEAARAYSADSSALISKELTSRAIGAIIVMVAGVLAAAAGIIGLIKSGKLSGLLSIVSAAAVIVGAAMAFLAGTTMSAIAGSTGSMLMLIAAGCVAVVGLAYGIVAMVAKTSAAA